MLGKRLGKAYSFKFVGFIDDFREVTIFNRNDVVEYNTEFDEPDYQKRRIYLDEVPT